MESTYQIVMENGDIIIADFDDRIISSTTFERNSLFIRSENVLYGTDYIQCTDFAYTYINTSMIKAISKIRYDKIDIVIQMLKAKSE